MFGSRCVWAFVLIVTAQVCPLGGLPGSEAKDLTEVLTQGLTFTVTGRDVPTTTRQYAPSLSAAFSQAVGRAVTQEFPHASVAPAFTYRLNPTLALWEQSTDVPGPLFSERALTLGDGQLNVGIGYSFIDFSELNGADLDNLQSSALLEEILINEATPDGRPGLFLAPAVFSRIRTRIDLNAHLIAPALRYGITERWDVSLVIPILHTYLRVRSETVRVVDVDPSFARFLFQRDEQEGFVAFGYRNTATGNAIIDISTLPLVKSQRRPGRLARAAGSSTGVGDITLRSKYQLWDTELGGAAFGLNLRLPSGEERDLRGTGETYLSTFLYVSQVLGERIEPHLNIGVDFNADDVDHSSFVYAVGASLLVGRGLGLTVDFIGRNEFGRFPFQLPSGAILNGRGLNRDPDSCTPQQPCAIGPPTVPLPLFPIRIERNDVADFSFGIRYALGTAGSLFFGGIVPLNDDGLRADFIPSGGVEYTF